MKWKLESRVSFPRFLHSLELILAELMKRRAMNGLYSSDEDEDSEDENYRSIRNAGRGRSRKHYRSRRGSNGSSVLDDPCGVRRKRNFFRSKNDDDNLRKQMGLSVPLASNGLTGDVTPEVALNGNGAMSLGMGLGLEGITGGRVTEVPSRAGSPGSVV